MKKLTEVFTLDKALSKALHRMLYTHTYLYTSVNPVPNAQVCYFYNVWLMF
jgi:hypothetical protein